MIRAHRRHVGAGDCALVVRLGFDDRHRRRLAVTALCGERLLIDLPEAAQLRGGDRLDLEDGRIVGVEAADEDVADIAASDPVTLARLAWHLGNRHTPAAVLDGRIRIRHDHVLEEMVARLGGTVTRLAAPFDPEPGAYDGPSGHGAGAHEHSHGHGHRHSHGHERPAAAGSVRGGPEAAPKSGLGHRHRVVACGDGADAAIAEPPPATTLSNADERAP